MGGHIHSGCFQLVDGRILDFEDYRSRHSHCYSYKEYVYENKEYLQQYSYPSQLFPILKERQQKDDAEEQKKEQEEKLRYEKERELKQEAQRQQELIRKQTLIHKYGSKYGTAIYNGKVELGMTIEMVGEIYGEGEITRHVSLEHEIIVLTYGGYNSFWGTFSKIRTYTFVNNRLTEYME